MIELAVGMLILPPIERLGMQTQELGGGPLSDRSVESGCGKKDDVPEDITWAKSSTRNKVTLRVILLH